MEVLLAVIAVIFGVVGIIGSVAPILPGPPLSWLGVLLMYVRNKYCDAGDDVSLTILFVLLGVTIVVSVLDYVVPAWFTKVTGGSKYAAWGTTIGLLVGLIFPLPIGMITCSLLCAFIGELVFAGKDAFTSLKSSIGAFFGFLFSTGLKLITCAVMLYYIIVFI